jgi:hypothetical protein
MLQFDADLASTDTGVWSDFLESKFLIAHISNMNFQRILARLQQPHRQKIERGTLDPQISKDLLCKAMSEGILLDWKNVVDGDGKMVDYTPQRGFVALSKNVEFRDFVTDISTNLFNFREEEVAVLGKA